MISLEVKLDKEMLSKIWEAGKYSNKLRAMTPKELHQHSDKCCEDVSYGEHEIKMLDLQKEVTDIQDATGKLMMRKVFHDMVKSTDVVPESATLVLQIK